MPEFLIRTDIWTCGVWGLCLRGQCYKIMDARAGSLRNFFINAIMMIWFDGAGSVPKQHFLTSHKSGILELEETWILWAVQISYHWSMLEESMCISSSISWVMTSDNLIIVHPMKSKYITYGGRHRLNGIISTSWYSHPCVIPPFECG